MDNGKSGTSQLRFEGGRLVEGWPDRRSDDEPPADSAEPSDETGFVLEVKSGAIGLNNTLPETVDAEGRAE